MILMFEFTYPAPKAQELAQAFIDDLQANPMPDYVKFVEEYISWGADGLKAHTYYELEKGKEEEGLRYVTAHELAMTKAVDGFRVLDCTPVYRMAEAYSVINMKGPAV
jgi:hypothetical protein